jgi:hypothetical protein
MVKLLRSHHKTIQSSIQSLTSHSQSLLKYCNLFRVGVADKNLPVTPFCWHDQIKESNCQVIFWDCPALASNQNWSVTEVTHQRGLEYCVIITTDTWLVAVVVAAAVLVIVVVVVSVIVEVEGATAAVVVV